MGCKGDRTREKKSSFPTSKMILKEEENINYEDLNTSFSLNQDK